MQVKSLNLFSKREGSVETSSKTASYRFASKQTQEISSISNKSKLPKILVFALSALAFIQASLGVMALRTGLPLKKPGEISNSSTWPEEIKILASSGQYQLSGKDTWLGIPPYTEALIKQLKKSDITGLEDANQALVNQGYKGIFNMHQYPVESSNRLNGWDKTNTLSRRIVLMLGQTDIIPHDMELIQREFQSIFNVLPENIKRFDNATPENIKDGIDWLVQQADSPWHDPAEILIYINSLGKSDSLFPFFSSKKEGDAEGIIVVSSKGSTGRKIDFPESALKAMLKDKFKGLKTYLIFDTSYAGSWVANGFKKDQNPFASPD